MENVSEFPEKCTVFLKNLSEFSGAKYGKNRVIFLLSHSLIERFSYSDGKESVYEEDNSGFLTAAALMIPRSAYAQFGLFDVIQESIEEGKRKKAEEEANKPRIRSFRLIAVIEKQHPKINWQKEKQGDYEGMVPLTEANLKKMETVTRIDLSAVSNWGQGGEEGDLSVLRYFPNLKELNVSGCRVTELGSAIMHLKQLEKLDCSGNELKELKIAGHPSLTEVNCRNNLFTTLDFGNIETLKRIDCS